MTAGARPKAVPAIVHAAKRNRKTRQSSPITVPPASRISGSRAAVPEPKWIAGVMRHGYKGAFEIAATVDYLFAFAATTNAVKHHHFEQLYDAYLGDLAVRGFLNAAAEYPDPDHPVHQSLRRLGQHGDDGMLKRVVSNPEGREALCRWSGGHDASREAAQRSGKHRRRHGPRRAVAR